MIVRLFHSILLLTLCATIQSARSAEIYAAPGHPGGPFYLKGTINADDAQKLLRVIGQQHGGTVILESPGGSLGAGLAIGSVLRKRNFTTAVPANAICASSCGLIWLSGARRYLHPEGRVGFHAASRRDDHSETGAGNAVLGAYLKELGYSYDAIFYVTQAPPNKIRWLTPSDAQKIRVSFTSGAPPSSPARSQIADKKDAPARKSEPPVTAPPANEGAKPKVETPVISAELPTLKREIYVAKGERVRANYFYNLNPDCSSVGRVSARIIQEPKFGTVATVNEPGFPNYPRTDERRKCNATPAELMAVYYSAAREEAEDAYVVQAFFPNGNTRRVEVIVRVR